MAIERADTITERGRLSGDGRFEDRKGATDGVLGFRRHAVATLVRLAFSN
jgi:hypothetical protein